MGESVEFPGQVAPVLSFKKKFKANFFSFLFYRAIVGKS